MRILASRFGAILEEDVYEALLYFANQKRASGSDIFVYKDILLSLDSSLYQFDVLMLYDGFVYSFECKNLTADKVSYTENCTYFEYETIVKKSTDYTLIHQLNRQAYCKRKLFDLKSSEGTYGIIRCCNVVNETSCMIYSDVNMDALFCDIERVHKWVLKSSTLDERKSRMDFYRDAINKHIGVHSILKSRLDNNGENTNKFISVTENQCKHKSLYMFESGRYSVSDLGFEPMYVHPDGQIGWLPFVKCNKPKKKRKGYRKR